MVSAPPLTPASPNSRQNVLAELKALATDETELATSAISAKLAGANSRCRSDKGTSVQVGMDDGRLKTSAASSTSLTCNAAGARWSNWRAGQYDHRRPAFNTYWNIPHMRLPTVLLGTVPHYSGTYARTAAGRGNLVVSFSRRRRTPIFPALIEVSGRRRRIPPHQIPYKLDSASWFGGKTRRRPPGGISRLEQFAYDCSGGSRVTQPPANRRTRHAAGGYKWRSPEQTG